VALALGLDDGARGVEGDALADAGEDIGELFGLAAGVADPAGGDDGQPEAAGEVEHGGVAVLLVAQVVALDLDVEPVGEEVGEALELAAAGVETAVEQALGDEALGAAGEAVQALGVDRDIGHGGAGLALGAVAGRFGEEAAEVGVAAAVGREER
jgi:hypothetical protein